MGNAKGTSGKQEGQLTYITTVRHDGRGKYRALCTCGGGTGINQSKDIDDRMPARLTTARLWRDNREQARVDVVNHRMQAHR